MKGIFSRKTQSAFTLLEFLIVFGTLLIAAGLLLPMFAKARAAKPINCVSNLRQVGLAFRMWANDHGNEFPMAVPADNGGSMEFNETGRVFRHFLAISNEVNSPKVLACYYDKDRTRATNFGVFDNRNLSYFVGLDAAEARPHTILSGDRNITGGTRTTENVTVFLTNSLAGWSGETHSSGGNIGLADGSVQGMPEHHLRRQIRTHTNGLIRLAIP